MWKCFTKHIFYAQHFSRLWSYTRKQRKCSCIKRIHYNDTMSTALNGLICYTYFIKDIVSRLYHLLGGALTSVFWESWYLRNRSFRLRSYRIKHSSLLLSLLKWTVGAARQTDPSIVSWLYLSCTWPRLAPRLPVLKETIMYCFLFLSLTVSVRVHPEWWSTRLWY